MKVVIPVAGFGSRLRPHTLLHPKVLLKVAHKPMIFFIVDQILKEKISDHIVFIIGYLGEDIKEYILKEFADYKNVKFEFVVQDIPKGLGHAIHTSKKAFTGNKDTEIFIILGDTLFDVDLKKLINNKNSVIGVKKVDNPQRFGVVEKNDNGIITKFVEKPASKEVSPSNDAIVGLYYIKNSDLLFDSIEYLFENEIKTKDEYQLTDALARMIELNEKMETYNVDGWLDCGKHETILETNSYILNKHFKNQKYNFPDVKINYPVFIGENVDIKNSEIGPNVSIHDNCKISDSKIFDSIIDTGSEITLCKINNSLIGKFSKMKNYNGQVSMGDYSEVKAD